MEIKNPIASAGACGLFLYFARQPVQFILFPRPPSEPSLKCELIVVKTICLGPFRNKFQDQTIIRMSNLAHETSNFSLTIPCFVIACVVYISFGESENKGPSNASEITAGTELGINEREG